MSTKIRRKHPSVIEHLLSAPYDYGFFQAIRLLERSIDMDENGKSSIRNHAIKRFPIGLFVQPTTEIVRLTTRTSLDFPENEIHSIKESENWADGPRWEMAVNFMGLTGSMGVLPYHYTETLLRRLKQKDESLMHFLDLFNHRTLSLFYRAGTKYSFARDHERRMLNPVTKKTPSDSTQALLSLIGLGTQRLSNRMHIKDESLIFYSGLFNQRVRGAAGLKQILSDYFELPVKILQFIGQWQDLIPDIRTRLASKQAPKGQNAALAKSAMLGAKGWIGQGKIRIELGPLNKEQFNRFAPGTNALKAMNDLVQLYLGLEHDYEFVIEVTRSDLPKQIQMNKDACPILGWNTWLSTNAEKNSSSTETFRIKASAKR